MKLYVGSRDYKPSGYLTVDIDPGKEPDVVADLTDMRGIRPCEVDEIVASHVLEHIDWPDTFKAFSEFARVLKPNGVLRIAVPDMAALVRMLLSGDSAWHVMALVYGVGGRTNPFEQHRFGFTPGMLVDLLETLGFGEFDWWNSSFEDASNGWVPRWEGAHAALSLNVSARKLREPAVEPDELHEALVRQPMSDFLALAAGLRARSEPARDGAQVPRLYQQIHFQLIEAQRRIAYLENQLTESSATARSRGDAPSQ